MITTEWCEHDKPEHWLMLMWRAGIYTPGERVCRDCTHERIPVAWHPHDLCVANVEISNLCKLCYIYKSQIFSLDPDHDCWWATISDSIFFMWLMGQQALYRTANRSVEIICCLHAHSIKFSLNSITRHKYTERLCYAVAYPAVRRKARLICIIHKQHNSRYTCMQASLPSALPRINIFPIKRRRYYAPAIYAIWCIMACFALLYLLISYWEDCLPLFLLYTQKATSLISDQSIDAIFPWSLPEKPPVHAIFSDIEIAKRLHILVLKVVWFLKKSSNILSLQLDHSCVIIAPEKVPQTWSEVRMTDGLDEVLQTKRLLLLISSFLTRLSC